MPENMSTETRLRGLTRRIPLVGPRLARQPLPVFLAAYVGYQVLTTGGAIYLGSAALSASPSPAEKQRSLETKRELAGGVQDSSSTGELTLSDGSVASVAYSCKPLTVGNVINLDCTLTPPSPAELGEHFKLEARVNEDDSTTLVKPECGAGNPYIPPIEDPETVARLRETCQLAELALSEYVASANGHR